jgi:hypothetical protein
LFGSILSLISFFPNSSSFFTYKFYFILTLDRSTKFLEKQAKVKPKTSRGKEIIKIRSEIDETESKEKPYKESTKQKAEEGKDPN